jgi:hypothetical protein
VVATKKAGYSDDDDSKFSSDIQMDFGLDKLATAVFKHSKLTISQNISLNNQTLIRNMELDQTYKYLDTEEGECIGNSQVDKLEGILPPGQANSQDPS